MQYADDRQPKSRGLVALVVSLCLCAGPAFGGEIENAKAAFSKARELARNGDYRAALESIETTERIMKHPTVTLLKARVLRKLGRLVGAKTALDGIRSAELPRGLRSTLRQEKSKIATAHMKLAHLVLDVEPLDASVSLGDDRFVGSAERWLAPGEHRVEVIGAGHVPAVRKVTLEAGVRRKLTVRLRRAGASIRLTVPGGLMAVDVLIDERKVAIDEAARVGDVVTVRAAAGRHEIRCLRGRRGGVVEVQVPPTGVVEATCRGLGGQRSVARSVLGWGGVTAGAALASYGIWGITSYFSDVAEADANLNTINAKVDPNTGLVRGGGVRSNKHYGGAAYLLGGVAVGVVSYYLWLHTVPQLTALPPVSDGFAVWADDLDPDPAHSLSMVVERR